MKLLANHEKEYIKSQMRSYLFTDHEKEYFNSRTPKKFVMSENGPVIEVGGIGNDTGTNEKFVWGGYEAASRRANKYLVTPLPTEKESGRYRLERRLPACPVRLNRRTFVSHFSIKQTCT